MRCLTEILKHSVTCGSHKMSWFFCVQWLAVNTVTINCQGQRISDCEVLSPIWDIDIIPSPQGSGKRRRGKERS